VTAGHDAPGGGQDVDPESALDTRDVALADVDAAARARNALDLGDDGRVIGAVLQVDLDDLFHALFGDLVVGNVAFLFEDSRDFGLQLRCGHIHLGVAGDDRVAHACEHVGNWITGHAMLFPFLTGLGFTNWP